MSRGSLPVAAGCCHTHTSHADPTADLKSYAPILSTVLPSPHNPRHPRHCNSPERMVGDASRPMVSGPRLLSRERSPLPALIISGRVGRSTASPCLPPGDTSRLPLSTCSRLPRLALRGCPAAKLSDDSSGAALPAALAGPRSCPGCVPLPLAAAGAAAEDCTQDWRMALRTCMHPSPAQTLPSVKCCRQCTVWHTNVLVNSACNCVGPAT